MDSRPRSVLFSSTTHRIGVYNTPKYGTKPIRYVSFTFEIGAAQPGFITEIAPPQRFFCVNRSPLRYEFCGGAEVVRYRSINIAFNQCRNPKVKWSHAVSGFCDTAAFLLFLLCFCWRLFQKVSFSDSFLPVRKFSSTDNCSSYLEVVDSFLIWLKKNGMNHF